MKKSKPIEKIYVVRKYVKAISVKQAIRNEYKFEIDSCFLSDEWEKANPLIQSNENDKPVKGFL